MAATSIECVLPQSAKLIYSFEELDTALESVAEKLNQRFKDEEVTLINILQGGTVTVAHLLIKLTFLIQLDSVNATRYRNQTVGHELEWKQYPASNLENKTVILVDDIFDEGITISEVKEYCVKQGAREVITVVLLDKQHQRKLTQEKPDYVALNVPDVYVFGFGLDYQGRYRNAPGIYALNDK
ncbi:MAG: hypoxanthine-guanine phosphoribosyltransferase [Cellvibrionaceae bacterium]